LELWSNPLEVLAWILLLALVSVQITLPPLIHVRILSIDLSPRWIGSGNGWLLSIWILSIGLGLAGPWIFEAVCRWFCQALRFSDDSRADFSGRGGQIFGWWILWMLAGHRWNIATPERVALEIALFFLGLWSTLNVLRWFVSHIELTTGRRLVFDGGYVELLGWQILLALSVLTIIGWAWALAAMYRWLADHTSGPDAVVKFHGVGGQILWRTLAAFLFSIPVVTIPWAWLWYARWLVRSTTLEGRVEDAELSAA